MVTSITEADENSVRGERRRRMDPACPVTLQGVAVPSRKGDSVSRRRELLWLEACGSDVVGLVLRTQMGGK